MTLGKGTIVRCVTLLLALADPHRSGDTAISELCSVAEILWRDNHKVYITKRTLRNANVKGLLCNVT